MNGPDHRQTHPLTPDKRAVISAVRTVRLDALPTLLDEICNPRAPKTELSDRIVFKRTDLLHRRLDRVLDYVDWEELCVILSSNLGQCVITPQAISDLPPSNTFGMEIRITKEPTSSLLISTNLAEGNAMITTTWIAPDRFFSEINTERAMLAVETVVDAVLSPYEEALRLPPLCLTEPESHITQVLLDSFSDAVPPDGN